MSRRHVLETKVPFQQQRKRTNCTVLCKTLSFYPEANYLLIETTKISTSNEIPRAILASGNQDHLIQLLTASILADRAGHTHTYTHTPHTHSTCLLFLTALLWSSVSQMHYVTNYCLGTFSHKLMDQKGPTYPINSH